MASQPCTSHEASFAEPPTNIFVGSHRRFTCITPAPSASLPDETTDEVRGPSLRMVFRLTFYRIDCRTALHTTDSSACRSRRDDPPRRVVARRHRPA